MTSWDLRQDDDVKLFGLELKSKDIDQTDWQIQNTQFQDSLSETCNVRKLFLEIISKLRHVGLFERNRIFKLIKIAFKY